MSTLSPTLGFKVANGIDADAYSADVNGTGIDCRGFDYALIVVNMGDLADTVTALDITVQESSDDAVGDAYADVTGATINVDPDGNTTWDNTARMALVRLRGRERYLRVILENYAGSGTADLGVSVLLTNAQYAETDKTSLDFSV